MLPTPRCGFNSRYPLQHFSKSTYQFLDKVEELNANFFLATSSVDASGSESVGLAIVTGDYVMQSVMRASDYSGDSGGESGIRPVVSLSSSLSLMLDEEANNEQYHSWRIVK